MVYLRVVALLSLFAIVNTFTVNDVDKPLDVYALKAQVLNSPAAQEKITTTCQKHKQVPQCESKAGDALFCELLGRSHPKLAAEHCSSKKSAPAFLQIASKKAPEDELAKEMTHDLEMNFNKIAPFGK